MTLTTEEEMKVSPEVRRLIRINKNLGEAFDKLADVEIRLRKKRGGMELAMGLAAIGLTRREIAEIIQTMLAADPNATTTYSLISHDKTEPPKESQG